VDPSGLKSALNFSHPLPKQPRSSAMVFLRRKDRGVSLEARDDSSDSPSVQGSYVVVQGLNVPMTLLVVLVLADIVKMSI
jgi:hypothetical protein